MAGLHETLVGYSDWLGYGHAERAEAWLARLEVNRAELEAFRMVPVAQAQPWLARASPVRAADGRGKGSGEPMRADAAEALDRARERDSSPESRSP